MRGRPACPSYRTAAARYWGLHLLAATACGELAETMPHRWTPPQDELWLDEPRAEDGYIAPLDRPGFGVVLNEAML